MVDAVLEALGLSPAADAEQITTGFDADVWRVGLADGRTVALRVLPAGRTVDADVATMRLAAARGVPVPQVLATAHHDGHAAMATTWCPGRPIGETLLAGGDPESLGELLGRTHADLHRPAADGSVLCHLDFQPFNVLADDGTPPAVTGIVDWTNARLGDPREDLATTRVVLALAPALLPGAGPVIETLTAAWARGYGAVWPMPADTELAPFLHAAATKQHADWAARVANGAAPVAVADAARTIAERRW